MAERSPLAWAFIRAMQPGGLARNRVRDLDIRLGADLGPFADALAGVVDRHLAGGGAGVIEERIEWGNRWDRSTSDDAESGPPVGEIEIVYPVDGDYIGCEVEARGMADVVRSQGGSAPPVRRRVTVTMTYGPWENA